MSEHRMIEAARVRGLIDGIESVAGVKGRDMALRHAGLEEYIENPPPMSEAEAVPAEHYLDLVAALNDVFGKGSRPLLMYAAEETMKHGLEGMPRVFGGVMKVLPGGLRKQAIFKVIIGLGVKATGVAPTVEFGKGKITFSDTACTTCSGRHSDEPMCHFESGLLLAAAQYATGKKHRVTEVKCKAVGDEACVYVIEEL